MPRLMAGHMAANMANNVQQALTRWPVGFITVWMDSSPEDRNSNEEAQYFLEILPNRQEHSSSRGALVDKMEKGDWFTGPEWLQHKEKWPEQPRLVRSTEANEE